MEKITVACVNVGNYLGCGEEYVRRLKAGVERHLSIPHRFVCFTDSPIDGIECLHSGLRGWWAKIEMFNALKERVLYFDLDTVIVGGLDLFASYSGKLAVLRDFYRPQGYGSGMMIWNGDQSRIWRDWCAAGQPKPEGGDQVWIERYPADLIQEKFPGVQSFKVENGELKDGASVVCFHGYPKPHDVCDCEWVNKHWGGGFHDTTKKKIENAEVNLSRDIPLIVQCEPNNSSALIVCGEKLPDRQGAIFSVNAHDYLVEHGVVPDFHVAVEGNITPHKDVTYLVSAQCDPSVFEKLKDHNVIMWLYRMNYGERDLAEKFKHKPIMTIGGSESLELKAMLLAHLAGFRNQHIYGMKHTKEFEWTCRLLGKEGAAIYVHS